jgi:hypothetical protein
MELPELSDRAEIADLLARYARAVDDRRWDDLDDIFTPDASIDYSAFGGPKVDLSGAKRFLAEALPIFAKTQHMLGLPAITLDGDRARSVTPCHNPMVLGEGTPAKVMVCALWYHHELVRRSDGWRICRMSQERAYTTVLAGDP